MVVNFLKSAGHAVLSLAIKKYSHTERRRRLDRPLDSAKRVKLADDSNRSVSLVLPWYGQLSKLGLCTSWNYYISHYDIKLRICWSSRPDLFQVTYRYYVIV